MEIEPHGLYVGNFPHKGRLHRRFVVSKPEFFGAEDDDGGAAHEKRFDHELHG